MQILRYIKKHIIEILIIAVLLAVQAIGIIILQKKKKKMVDIGIERYGIENAVPIKIRKEEMKKLMVFINDTSVLENYDLTDDNVYSLKDNVDIEKLNIKFARAESLVLIVENDESITNIREKIKTNITSDIRSMIGGSSSLLDTLAMLDSGTLSMVNKIIDEKLQVLSDDILLQVSSKYLEQEYKLLGIKNNYLLKNTIIMIGIAFIVFLSYCIENYIIYKFAANASKNIRTKIYDKILNMNEQKFNEFEQTSLINRTVNDVNIIQKAIPILFRTFVYGPIIFIGSYIKVKKFGNQLEGALIIVVITIFIVGISLLKKIISIEEGIRKRNDNINSTLRDALNNLLIVKGMGKLKHLNKFKKINSSIMEESEKSQVLSGFCIVLLTLTVHLSSVYILWLGSIKIEKGLLTIGALIAIIDYLFQISFLIINILKNSIYILTGFISFKRCRVIYLIKTSNENLQDIQTVSSIEFKNVYFKYPNTSNYVLKNFSMKINKKDHAVITGSNASGKSTIIKLLLKFYKPNEGKILINGININEIDTNKLRNIFSVVPQENEVFAGEINNNIKLGNKDLSLKELANIKQTAELTEFNNKNQEIYYQGKNISGGQKQRIAIARALAKNFEVLVLDEAFASLDINTKNKIKNNLIENYKEKTIIDIGQNIEDRIFEDKVVEL